MLSGRGAPALRRIGIYGGGVFFALMSIAQPFFTLYAEKLGASTALIGTLVMLRAVVPMIIAMPVGQMIDSLGPLRMTKLGTGMLIASLAIMATSQTLLLLGVSQVLLGASMIIVASSLQVLASDGEPDKTERNRSINRYSMWSSIGSMAGPLFGGAVVSVVGSSPLGYRAAFAVSAIVGLVALVLAYALARGKEESSATLHELRELFRLRGIVDSYVSGLHLTRIRAVQFGLMGTFLIMFIQSLYSSFLPLYLNFQGYSPFAITVIVALTGAAGFVSRFALDVIMKRTTLERILLAAGMLASACLILVPIASLNIVGIGALAFLLGGSAGMNLPVSIMIMVDDTQEKDRGKVMGLRLLTNRVSQMLSPALFGLMGQTLGLSSAFYAGGGMLLATMLGFAAYSSGGGEGGRAGGSSSGAIPGPNPESGSGSGMNSGN